MTSSRLSLVVFFKSVSSPPNMLFTLTGLLFFTGFGIALQASCISCIIVEVTPTLSNTWNEKHFNCNTIWWDGVMGRKSMDLLWTTPIPRIFLGIWVWPLSWIFIGIWVWLLTTKTLVFARKIHEITPICIENSWRKEKERKKKLVIANSMFWFNRPCLMSEINTCKVALEASFMMVTRERLT